MNCPRCEKYIVPEFYCINCGYVPPRMQDPVPNYIAQLDIPRISAEGKKLSEPLACVFSD